MRLLELALPSEQKAVLTAAPSAMRQRLEGKDGIDRVAIWTQPYDVLHFRLHWTEYPDVVQAWQRDMAPLQPPWPLLLARRQQIRGQFTDEEYHEGAQELYLKSRLSDRQIGSIRSADALQAFLTRLLGGAAALPDQPALLQQMLQATREVLRFTRGYASFQLGQIAFETAEPRVATDFFDKRILAEEPQSLWRPGCLYNLGRAQEALGRAAGQTEPLQRAVEYYLAETESPQGPGNRLRAERLQEEINAMETAGP
jgi:hypothetical protein